MAPSRPEVAKAIQRFRRSHKNVYEKKFKTPYLWSDLGDIIGYRSSSGHDRSSAFSPAPARSHSELAGRDQSPVPCFWFLNCACRNPAARANAASHATGDPIVCCSPEQYPQRNTKRPKDQLTGLGRFIDSKYSEAAWDPFWEECVS